MASNPFGIIVGKINLLKEMAECDAVVEAAYAQKSCISQAMGTTNDKEAKRSITRQWREYQELLVHGDAGKKCCPYCNRKVTLKKFQKWVYFQKPTPALHNGQDIVVRACCLPCHNELVQRYEKECEWLRQQQTELSHMKLMVKATSQGVSQLLKKESRPAKSLPVS